MSNPFSDSNSSHPNNSGETENENDLEKFLHPESGVEPISDTPESHPHAEIGNSLSQPKLGNPAPLIMVETAFLASTASLIWLINYYFPLGPVLRIFFPVPIALVYLRWGNRAAWMAALVSGLLLSVLMGPMRSIQYVIPFGVLGVVLGLLWRRGAGWSVSIFIGMLIGSFGFFFRLWLVSILLGEDLWAYLTIQITEFTQWGFERLGLLQEPSLPVVQLVALLMVMLNNIVYLFAVHLAACLLLERLGNPIPPPPPWVQVLLDEE